VLVHGSANLSEGLFIAHEAQIDRSRLRAEEGMQWGE
jgi:hypothetical protein